MISSIRKIEEDKKKSKLKIKELFEKEEELDQEIAELANLIDELEKKAITITSTNSSSLSDLQNNTNYVIFSNGIKIDHKIKRIFQTFRNLRLFCMILKQYHGTSSLAPITLNGHRIILNYTPKHLISACRITTNIRRLDYANGDVAYEYNNNGSVVVNTKKFSFTTHENKDEEINFPDGCKAYFYASARTLEYFDRNEAVIRIFQGGIEEIHFNKGKTYIFDLSGEIVVQDQDGDERLRRKFKVVQ